VTPRFWSFVLQWSRVGINAALFLVAARFLTLGEIGAFATAFAPIRMTQGLHKAGICESVIVFGKSQQRRDALFALSLGSGLALALTFVLLALALNAPLLLMLAPVPLLNGLSAVSEGILRQTLRLRALALRTLFSQSAAALLALWLLWQGAGAWSLVAFALVNAMFTLSVSVYLARWRPRRLPPLRHLRLLWPKTAQIAGRDMLGAALFPVIQLCVGLFLGLPAAGAFQIATRVLGLIEALSLSPLRFIALPQLRLLRGAAFRAALADHLSVTATLSVCIWGGTYIAAPQILAPMIGAEHVAASAPTLIALAGFGLTSALSMPINQALIARGQMDLMLARAGLLLLLGVLFSLPALALSTRAVGLALSLAMLVTSLWHVSRAVPRLGLGLRDLYPVVPPVAVGLVALTIFELTPSLPIPAHLALMAGVLATLLIGPLRRNPL